MKLQNNRRLNASFYLGNLHLGAEALRIQEIIRVPPRTRVYMAPQAVWGVVNLRGKIVTVWELSGLLGLEASPLGEDSRIIVVQMASEPVGFLVDSLSDVVEIDPELIRPVPGNIDPQQGKYLQAITGDEGSLMGILNLEVLEAEVQK